MKKLLNYGYVAIFLLLLIVPLIRTNTREDVKSELDNRVLVEFPEIGEDGFEAGIENYLQDRIGLRNRMVTGYQILNDRLAGELTHPNYTYGQDGYMFFKMHDNIEFGAYHQTFAEAVVKMSEYCKARGVPFYFMFEPEKISVYRDYLPAGVNYNDEWVDTLLSTLEEHGVTVINNKELLVEKSKEEQVFNRQYDAGHWNDLGCFYGTNNLWEKVHEDFPAVNEYSLDDFEVEIKDKHYLKASRFLVQEKVSTFTLKARWRDITDDYSDIEQDSRYRFFCYYVNRSKKAQKYPKMLVFHGSYYNRSPQFFIGRAKEYIGVHDYQNVLNLDYYFNLFQPEMVVFEAAEYTLSDGYFDSKTMSGIDYNPVLSKEAKDVVSVANDRVYIIPRDTFDTVYYDRDVPEAHYSYIQSDNLIYDLSPDANGVLRADVPHGSVGNKAALVYSDYLDDTYIINAEVRNAQSFAKEQSLSDGVTLEDGQYVFKTTRRGNRFSQMDIQLFDGISGEYLYTIYEQKKPGSYCFTWIHTKNDGWYKIRLKANSNLQDERIDSLAYLIKGEKYHISFNIVSFDAKHIRIKDYKCYGPCTWIINGGDNIFGSRTELSAGCREEDGKYIMSSSMEENRFSAVVFQVFDSDGRFIENINSLAGIGGVYGIYENRLSDGNYTFVIRGNSNKADETITSTAELATGDMVKYEYNVESSDEKELIVSGINVVKLVKAE